MKDKEERIGKGGVSLHNQRKSDTNGGESNGREIEGEESSCTTIVRKVQSSRGESLIHVIYWRSLASVMEEARMGLNYYFCYAQYGQKIVHR